jgi:hypothetical protein
MEKSSPGTYVAYDQAIGAKLMSAASLEKHTGARETLDRLIKEATEIIHLNMTPSSEAAAYAMITAVTCASWLNSCSPKARCWTVGRLPRSPNH